MTGRSLAAIGQPYLQTIKYAVRGPDSNNGTIGAYITPDVDTWGKRTIRVMLANGDLQTWYLFDDEWKVVPRENHA